MDIFYETLPRHRDFVSLTDPTLFVPLPDDWVVCCSDIVNSTDLVSQGRYKLVNTIGASVIAALQNALDGAAFPYVFGGDGTSLAVPAQQGDEARLTLARLRHWIAQEFGISLRVAAVPVHKIRAQGLDVKVARHAVSLHADYAMFSGGGISWAEDQMKQGRLSLPDCGETTPPDLTGLSCRWDNIPARNGMILSLVLVPLASASPEDFATIARQVVAIAARQAHGGHPVPRAGPGLSRHPAGLDPEARLTRANMPLILQKLGLSIRFLAARWMMQRRKSTFGWDPIHYLATMQENTDYQKFEDGLKMTIDCSASARDRIVEILGQARANGVIRYGLHAQEEALLTCIVPSSNRDDHVHFVDGAAGGYTRAAANMRQMQDLPKAQEA